MEPDGFVEVSDGLVVVPLGLPGKAAPQIPIGIPLPRIEPDGLVIVADRLARPGSAAADVGVVWIEPDGLIVVFDGLVVGFYPATCRLPLPPYPATEDDRRRLARHLRELHYNPQRHLPPEAAAEFSH